MDLNIKGRVAIVTGASQGLGFACAEALAAEGVEVVLAARNVVHLQSAARELSERFDVRITPVPTDVTHEDEVSSLIDQALSIHGRVDICIANAAGPAPATLMQTSRAQWAAALDSNLLSVVQLAQATLPRMEQAGWGRFLTISSVVAKQPMDRMILSNAVRPGVGGLVKTLSNEYAARGVTVNNLCPGFIATPRLLQLQNSHAATRNDLGSPLQHIPAKRIGQPPEFGAVAAFLCSMQAAYITGISLMIDGGYHKSW